MNPYSYPPGFTFLQTYQRALKLINNPLPLIAENVKRFGDSYSVASGLRDRMILTQDPEFIDYILKKNHRNYHKSKMVTQNLAKFIGNGLLSSNGAYWLRQRRLIQPGFHIQKIQGLYGIMKKTIDDYLNHLPTGERIDVYPLMNRLAFDVVIKTLFDIDLPKKTVDELSRFISETQEFVIRDIRQPYKSWWFKLKGEVRYNLKNSAWARDILREIIRKRKATTEKFNDLLDMLLDARYEDTGEAMTEDQILDEIFILIIAGHETSANVMTWMSYLLANHPQEVEKLRQSSGDLSVMDCVSHTGITNVIQESMRLYPPAYASDRVALEDDSFKDYSYKKGTVVVLYYYGLHRNPKFWPDPDAFNPERFLASDKEGLKTFYPFGGGPRLCIGNNFAMAEMALFVQALVQKFNIYPTDSIPKMKPLLTLRPEGVALKIEKRN
ncbi:MAG TPA: cytochrome P450 [Cyclobacteriaceae bacterium]|nr:cytochrome P450 [Cyclobacteriaceae bacterium]